MESQVQEPSEIKSAIISTLLRIALSSPFVFLAWWIGGDVVSGLRRALLNGPVQICGRGGDCPVVAYSHNPFGFVLGSGILVLVVFVGLALFIFALFLLFFRGRDSYD
jgi:hypothetical protein